MENLTLLSTVVAPAFTSGRLELEPVAVRDLGPLLMRVTRNLHGHAPTVALLALIHHDQCIAEGELGMFPASERGFWPGDTPGLAVRPRGGVRGAAQTGDTPVGPDDLEAVIVRWYPGDNGDYYR